MNKTSYPKVNRSSDLQVSLFNLEGAIERLWTFKKWKEWKYFRSPVIWGCSSAGRAPALQAGGQEFDSPHLHQRASEDGNDDRSPKIKWACSSGG